MRWIVFALALMTFGCVREPSRQATLGALDAIERPDPNNPLAMKLHVLANRYADAALHASPPEGLDKIVADVVSASLKAAQQHGPEETALMRLMMSEMLKTGINVVKEEIPGARSMGQSSAAVSSGVVAGVVEHGDELATMLVNGSSQAGRAFAGGAADELMMRLERELGPDGQGPLSRALAGSLERMSGAIVKGAVTHVGDEAAQNPNAGPSGADDLVRRLSRSAAMGVAEGVGQRVSMWEIAVAIFAGVLIAVGANLLFKYLVRRGHFRMLTTSEVRFRRPYRVTRDVPRHVAPRRYRLHGRDASTH